jgi:hypothetical protein
VPLAVFPSLPYHLVLAATAFSPARTEARRGPRAIAPKPEPLAPVLAGASSRSLPSPVVSRPSAVPLRPSPAGAR